MGWDRHELLWNEMGQKNMSHGQACELQYYRLLLENSLNVCFPKLDIALRIYLSMMITNCTDERSFSKLKRIKMNFGPPWAKNG